MKQCEAHDLYRAWRGWVSSSREQGRLRQRSLHRKRGCVCQKHNTTWSTVGAHLQECARGLGGAHEHVGVYGVSPGGS